MSSILNFFSASIQHNFHFKSFFFSKRRFVSFFLANVQDSEFGSKLLRNWKGRSRMMKPIGSNSLKSLMHTQTGLSTLELSLWVSQFLAHSKPIRHQDNRHQRKFLIRRATVFRRVLNGTSYALWKKERWKGCVFVRGVSVRSLWKLSEKKREGRKAAMIGLTYGKRLSTRQQQKQNYIFFRKFDFLERT